MEYQDRTELMGLVCERERERGRKKNKYPSQIIIMIVHFFLIGIDGFLLVMIRVISDLTISFMFE